MRSWEINQFMHHIGSVERFAERIRASKCAQNGRESVSRFVRFESIEGEPLDFKVDAYQGRFIARFEISRQTMQERPCMAGQYSFFQLQGDKETPLPSSVKFVPPVHSVLPDGSFVDRPYIGDDAAPGPLIVDVANS
jgi:hypothetical protein